MIYHVILPTPYDHMTQTYMKNPCFFRRKIHEESPGCQVPALSSPRVDLSGWIPSDLLGDNAGAGDFGTSIDVIYDMIY